MSSVVSPVGPLPPRVYWVRRLVVLGVPLILILIIAVSCAGGGGKKSPTAGSVGPTTTPTTTTSSSSDPNAACVPGDLSAQLAVSAPDGIYQLGDSPVFTATIRNVSATACQFTSNPANEIWTVVTGADKFWTTAGCQSAGTTDTKSLAAGATRRLTVTWDGKRLLPGCTHGSAAPAGTYRLHARLDGVKASQVIFHFHDTTQ